LGHFHGASADATTKVERDGDRSSQESDECWCDKLHVGRLFDFVSLLANEVRDKTQEKVMRFAFEFYGIPVLFT
jgi:hypothetical protein